MSSINRSTNDKKLIRASQSGHANVRRSIGIEY